MVVLCLCCFPYPSPMLWGTVQWVPRELRNDSYLCERRSSEDMYMVYSIFGYRRNDHELERISVDIFLFFVNQGFVLVTFQ